MQNLKNVFWNLMFTYVLLFIGHGLFMFLKDLVNHFRKHPGVTEL